MLYYATFVTGLHEPIGRIVSSAAKHIKVNRIFDGGCIIESNKPPSLPCFNNIFALIDIKRMTLDAMLRHTCTNRAKYNAAALLPDKRGTFRVITSVENKLCAVDNNVLVNVERFITAKTGMRSNRAKPDVEYWFLLRSEGYCLFMRRITKHASYEKLLHKGELRPELAYCLNFLAYESLGKRFGTQNTVFSDPFCGYGSLAYFALKHFKYSFVYASDADNEMVKLTKKRLGGDHSNSSHSNSERINSSRSNNERPGTAKAEAKAKAKKSQQIAIVHHSQIESLDKFISDASIDAIVTDPPWGEFKDIRGGIQGFYNIMTDKLYRLLKPGGAMVILTSRAAELTESLNFCGLSKKLTNIGRYNILVSGKKASVFVFIKEI